MKYLLDSNICIHLLHNKFSIGEHIQTVGWNNCYISEITKIELLYGAECSDRPEENTKIIEDFCNNITTIPISTCIATFCKQKVRLRKAGKPIKDFDLLIASTAIVNHCTMVTEDIKHYSRINDIHLENWVQR
jgi:tRNA(fMet)-specific endonuclease VapC